MKTILLAFHLIAVATGTGMSIANYVNIRIAATEKGDRQASLVYLRRVLARFADVIIAAIFLTGIGLYYSLPPDIEPNSWFYALMVSAAILLVCHVAARLTANRMAATGDNSLYNRMEMLVSGVWLSALASIVFAVMTFET
jgi:uncharacterized membrane protein